MNSSILVDRERLLAVRQRLGLSQTELAARVEAAGGKAQPSFISRLESGQRQYLSVTNYAAFVKALDVPHTYLRADLVAA